MELRRIDFTFDLNIIVNQTFNFVLNGLVSQTVFKASIFDFIFVNVISNRTFSSNQTDSLSLRILFLHYADSHMWHMNNRNISDGLQFFIVIMSSITNNYHEFRL